MQRGQISKRRRRARLSATSPGAARPTSRRRVAGASRPPAPAPPTRLRSPAPALNQLRLVGVDGPYSVLLSAEAYTALAETSDNGYPVLEHVKKLVKDEIIWTPAIASAFVLTTRGGDFDLHIGQDLSIGYLS